MTAGRFAWDTPRAITWVMAMGRESCVPAAGGGAVGVAREELADVEDRLRERRGLPGHRRAEVEAADEPDELGLRGDRVLAAIEPGGHAASGRHAPLEEMAAVARAQPARGGWLVQRASG